MRTQELVAGLAVTPIRDERDRYTHGTVVRNETWCAVAVCCDPDCRWRATDKARSGTDLGVRAKNHAENHGHQTLMAWYAADRYLPDVGTPETATPRPGTAPPSHSDPRGRPDAHPDPANSRKTHTTARSTK